jgi:transcriptional regulator with XRE-family HTH domain
VELIVIMADFTRLMKKKASPSFRKLLGANLRRERKARGLSQEELADLARLHRTYVGSVERGERNVSIDNIERLARALGIEIAALLRKNNKV